MKVYTRKGDKGETSLFGGKRVPKNALQVDSYGTVDEANSALGLARALAVTPRIRDIIATLQEELFVLGAELASTPESLSRLRRRIQEEDIARLEKLIDEFSEQYPQERRFVPPGGSPGAGALDLARTIVRRAERLVTSLQREQGVRSELLGYLNRLSDLLFVLSRVEAQEALVREVKEKVVARLQATQPSSCGVTEMNLELAKRIIAASEAKAQEIGVPMVIAVVDSGGNLVALHRQDGALLASVDIAQNKAYTAVALKMPTAQVASLVQPGQPLYGLEVTNTGRMVVFGGGIPLWKGERVIGAIGVSGGSVEDDIQVAEAGASIV